MKNYTRAKFMPFWNGSDGLTHYGTSLKGVIIRYRASKNGPIHSYTAGGRRNLYTKSECIDEIKAFTAKNPIIVSQTLYTGKPE